MDYEQDLFIDESALDIEWLGQPTLMMRYASKLAVAEREVDRLEEALGVLKAELDKDIRMYPDNYNIDKITETVVTNNIILQKKYISAKNELIEARYERKMILGAVKAVEQRKDALEGLAKLLAQQYFAGPNVPRDLSDEVIKSKRQTRVDKSIKIMSRKKRS